MIKPSWETGERMVKQIGERSWLLIEVDVKKATYEANTLLSCIERDMANRSM